MAYKKVEHYEEKITSGLNRKLSGIDRVAG
jgi:hypothetical protein